MSNDSNPNRGVDKVRLLITGPIFLVIVACVIHIIWLLQPTTVGTRIPSGDTIMTDFGVIELLSLIILAVWILRPPPAGAVHFLARWAGQSVAVRGIWLGTFYFPFLPPAS